MIEQLLASNPHPSLGAEAHVFGRFIGAWDCDYTHFAADGSVSERYRGELLFAWIMDGRAIQDVWIGYPPDGEVRERSIGTSIRFFDKKSRLWHVVFVSPEGGAATTVRGGVVGDRIVLEGENADGSLRRWSFNDIRPNSFVWIGESSGDGGRSWRRTAEYHMSRRTRR